MFNYSFFIGIDVSKAVIDVSFYLNGKVFYLGQYWNSAKGFESMIKDLSFKTEIPKSNWFVCFENTGAYSKELLHWFISAGIPCREENPIAISKSLGIRRGKDDKIDSRDICNYAFEKRDSIVSTKLDKPFVIKLKTLLSRRDLFVKQRSALKVSLKEQKPGMDNDLYAELDTQNKSMIAFYDKQIKELENKIKQVIKSNPEASKNSKLLQSIVGVAKITSAYLISTTNNFESFTNARKYACYCGVAPFPNSSGIRKRKSKVNHMANKKMKSILANCVLTSIAYDPQISKYYKKKKSEGKPGGVVLNAIKNKLIQRVFAVIKRQSPYVKMMTYA